MTAGQLSSPGASPWEWGVAILLGLVALVGVAGLVGGLFYWHRRGRVDWRFGLQRAGWIVPVASAVALAGLIVLWGIQRSDNVKMAVEIVIPLAAAMQSALLLFPNSEPALEVLLSSPRPAPWLLLERMAVVLAVQGGIGLVGMAASMALAGETDVLLALARWLPPALFFSGVAVTLAIRTREPSLALAVVAVSWLFTFAARLQLLPPEVTGFALGRPFDLIQSFFWMVHPYLQPGMLSPGAYAVNRAILAGLGCLLAALAAGYLRDAEQVLLGTRARRVEQAKEGKVG